jgi:hypothetical protein
MQAASLGNRGHEELIAGLQGGCLMKIFRILFAVVALAVLTSAAMPAQAASHHHHHHHHHAHK